MRRLRQKVIVLAVAPLLLAVGLVGWAVQAQQRALAEREHALVEEATMSARRAELRQLVELAMRVLDTLSDADDAAQRHEALRRLGVLQYGHDGYFFVYDLHGRSLMHPQQPELVGSDLWDLRDAQGRPTIQRLVAAAREGGGYVTYPWRKPSTGEEVSKLGYVVPLPRFGWMLGTGIYLDDVQATLDRLDHQAAAHIRGTLGWMAGIALFGAACVACGGLLLNLSDHRESDQALRRMAHQAMQALESERAYLSRELHDGTSQTLVSAKLLVETAQNRLDGGLDDCRPGDAHELLGRASARLGDSLDEVRRLSHRLRPAMLDVLGLPAALEQVGHEMAEAADLAFSLRQHGSLPALPEELSTALFRVAQEALTNVTKHAQAHEVRMRLLAHEGRLRMSLLDDGRGFDVTALAADPRRGIGLDNMRERLASVGGTLRMVSAPGRGTRLVAEVPLPIAPAATRMAPAAARTVA